MKDTSRIEPARTKFTERLRPSLMGRKNCPRHVLAADGAGDQSDAESFDLSGKKNDGSSLLQPESVFGGQGQGRDVVQRGLDRKQHFRT